MVICGTDLLLFKPIKNMVSKKIPIHGTSYGLGEAGYDIRLKQDIRFSIDIYGNKKISILEPNEWVPKLINGRFTIASAVEEFQMPDNLVGIVHDKSTWARKGLSVFNTVIEPGWKGFLTLELIFNGWEDIDIPANTGIAQVIFHQISRPTNYQGKYQNQVDKPVDSIFE